MLIVTIRYSNVILICMTMNLDRLVRPTVAEIDLAVLHTTRFGVYFFLINRFTQGVNQ